MNTNTATEKADAVRTAVREGYAKIVNTGSERRSSGASCCCGSAPQTAEALAKHIGYSDDELTALPEGANMGLPNPPALRTARRSADLEIGDTTGLETCATRVSGSRVETPVE